MHWWQLLGRLGWLAREPKHDQGSGRRLWLCLLLLRGGFLIGFQASSCLHRLSFWLAHLHHFAYLCPTGHQPKQPSHPLQATQWLESRARKRPSKSWLRWISGRPATRPVLHQPPALLSAETLSGLSFPLALRQLQAEMPQPPTHKPYQ